MASRITTPLFLYWFAALLPPQNPKDKNDDDDEQRDYYQVLDVHPRSTPDEIKKAYKKKSLRLHPDKVTQRGGDPEASRVAYGEVQQAYQVLSDPKKRQKYHSYGRNPSMYLFMDSGNFYNPSMMYDNLINATCATRTRLFFLFGMLLPFLLIQPILICLKVNDLVAARDADGGGPFEATDWVVLLIPLWVQQALYSLTLAVIFVLSELDWIIGMQFIESFVLVAGELLLAFRFDGTVTWNYWDVLFPFYVLLGLRVLRRIATLCKVRREVGRMVTLAFVEDELGKPYEDLTEDERDLLAKTFIVVNVPDDVELDEDVDEVQASPEYEAAMDVYYTNLAALFNLIVFAIPQVVMIVLQLEQVINVTWWIVFVPSWAYVLVQFLWNIYQCCWGSGSMVVVPGEHTGNNQTNEDNEHQSRDDRSGDESLPSFTDPAPANSNPPKRQQRRKKQESQRKQRQRRKKQQEDDDGISEMTPLDPASVASEPNNIESVMQSHSNGIVSTLSVDSNISPDIEQPSGIGDESSMNDTDHDMQMDDETFEAFQHAYQEAEEHAIEAQGRAQVNCCLVIFQAGLLALVVGKVDGATYNSFWILSPVLLLSGCLLVVVAIVIYGAGRIGFDNLMDRSSAAEPPDDGMDGVMKGNTTRPDTEADVLIRQTVISGQDGTFWEETQQVAEVLTKETDGLLSQEEEEKTSTSEQQHVYDDDID